jgi:hypothetical protein
MVKGLLIFYLNDKGDNRVLLILFTTAITSTVVSQLFCHSCTIEAVQQPAYVRTLGEPVRISPRTPQLDPWPTGMMRKRKGKTNSEGSEEILLVAWQEGGGNFLVSTSVQTPRIMDKILDTTPYNSRNVSSF